eukprot:TRINITY_DN9836_c0_g1_i1.p1 TRINITY_DN9836_c0_g1~~TRINITY_DN9836_c0_g1_i1.p1  ORF type:complete len:252 (+),score=22.84 TRINITY_DN9836_c0_g1_i1:44-799(+)
MTLSPSKRATDADSMDDPPRSKLAILFRVVLVVSGLLSVFCLCYVALQTWKEVRSRERFSDEANDRDTEVTCLVKGRSEVQQTHNGYRSYITVEYVHNDTLLLSTCWSSHDGGFRSSYYEATKFISDYGEIGSLQTCWYDPTAPLNIRLWDDRVTYIRDPLFWAACFYAVIWFAIISGYVLHKKYRGAESTSNKQFVVDVKATFSNLDPGQPSFKNAFDVDSDSQDDSNPLHHATSPPRQGTYIEIPELVE